MIKSLKKKLLKNLEYLEVMFLELKKELLLKYLENFLEIKKIRDKLSHGERVEYNNIPVEKTRELIFKLLAQV